MEPDHQNEPNGPTKGAGDENFPVGSWLIARKLRPCVEAYYTFARRADDVADQQGPTRKRQRTLHLMDRVLSGEKSNEEGMEDIARLREMFLARHLPLAHARDLLVAFLWDTERERYASWEELMVYCRYSAAPVGRFLLALHGEDPSLFPMSDALCNALQVINHLQDQGEDYRRLNRIYLPQDWMAEEGCKPSMLAHTSSSPELARVRHRCLKATRTLLTQAKPFPSLLKSIRLSLESKVILGLAQGLVEALERHDPLAQRVTLSTRQQIFWSVRGLF